jgi:hypothetical protein
MHRSGTSALAGALRLCGLAAAKSVVPPSKANERGFWESAIIKGFDDELLGALGQSWHSLRPIHLDDFSVGEIARARTRALAILGEEYDGAASIVLKEPRLCRLLPFWEPVLEQRSETVGYALIVRNPEEVAKSLVERNDFDLDHGLLLWARYLLDAELNTRGRRRLFVSYANLLDDPPGVIKAVSDRLGLGIGLNRTELDALHGYLTPDLRHHRALDHESLSGKPQLISDSYRILREWSEGRPESEADHRKLDAARKELDRVGMAVADVLEHARLDRKRWTGTKSQLEQATSELVRLQRSFEQLQELRQALAESAERQAAQMSELAAAIEDRRQLEQALADATRASADAAARLERVTQEAAEAAERFEREKGAVESARQSIAAELDAEKEALRSAKETVERLDAELQRTKRKYRAAQWDIERERRAHDSTRADLAAAEAALERYRASFLSRAYTAVSGFGARFSPGAKRAKRRRRNEELQAIAGSGLFDSAWYLATYPDVAAAGVEPLSHFVGIGWREGRDPGPDFATSAYLKANPDVAHLGVNPLLHYIEFGRSEGREIQQHRGRPKEVAPVVHEFPEAAPVFHRENAPDRPIRWCRSHRLDPQDRRAVAAGEILLGYADAPKLRSTIEAAFETLASLSGLSGRGGQADLDVQYGSGDLIDAWYTNKAELRTRWRDDRHPFIVRAYQHDPHQNGRLVLIGEGLIVSDLDLVDLSLANPYYPALVLFAEPDGALRGARLMAFPSFCRGGLHYSELISSSQEVPDPLGAGLSAAKRLLEARNSPDRLIRFVAVDESGDDGTSTMSDAAFRLWLENVGMVAIDAAVPLIGQEAEARGGRLVLAPDMIPTVQILAECGNGGKPSSGPAFLPLLVAGDEPSQPAQLVELPRGASMILGVGASGYPAPWPRFVPGMIGHVPEKPGAAAIRLPNRREINDLELLVPAAGSALPFKEENSPAVAWLISAGDWEPAELVQAIRALSLQSGASAHSIVFVGDVDTVSRTVADEFFGGRVRVVKDLAAAAEAVDMPLVGHLGPGVILHDQRCVSALAALLSDQSVASAGCVLVTAEKRGKSWHASVADGGTIALDQPNGRTIAAQYSGSSLPWRASFAVFRPPRDLWIARASSVKSWIRSGAPQPLRKGMHVCTSLVTASYVGARAEHACEVPLPSASAGRSIKTKTLFG